MIILRMKSFKNDESGAVTVDWVVLTAALVSLGLGIVLAIASAAAVVVENTDTKMLSASDVFYESDGD